MKTLKTAFLASLLAIGALIAVLTSGCSTPASTAFKVESGANISVVSIMAAWDGYVAANHPGAAAELKVKAAYEKVQLAELALNAATTAWVLSTDTNSPSGTPANANAAQTAYNSTYTDLLTLVRSFGIKI